MTLEGGNFFAALTGIELLEDFDDHRSGERTGPVAGVVTADSSDFFGHGA